MRRSLTLIFVILLCFLTQLTNAQTYTGTTWNQAQRTKKADLTVLCLIDPPFAFIDAAGKLTGIELEIFQHFSNWVKNAKGIEINPNFIGIEDFSQFYKAVQDGDGGVIGLATITILERRKSEVKFSPTFMNNIAVLTSNSKAPDLTSLTELSSVFAGKKAIVAKGTTHDTYISELKQKYFPQLQVEYTTSPNDAALKTIDDPNYFTYMDLANYWLLSNQENKALKRHPVGDLSAEQFGFIMPLNSDWDGPMNDFFSLGAGYRSTSAYRNVLIKYLGPEVSRMLDIARRNAVE